MNVKTMSLPRRSGTSSAPGVAPKRSAFASFAKAASSRSVSTTRCACASIAREALVVATGTPKVCNPSEAQVIHTVAVSSAPRAARSRCAASSSPSRTDASAMSTTSETASTTAPTAAQAAVAPPIESATNDWASSSRPQSRTRLKFRPRYSVKPMSSRFSTVSAPRTVPNSAAATRRGTRGRQSSSTAATTASTGIRAKRLGSRAAGVFGSSSAPHTRMAERAVVTRRTTTAARGCRERHARPWARRAPRAVRASAGRVRVRQGCRDRRRLSAAAGGKA